MLEGVEKIVGKVDDSWSNKAQFNGYFSFSVIASQMCCNKAQFNGELPFFVTTSQMCFNSTVKNNTNIQL